MRVILALLAGFVVVVIIKYVVPPQYSLIATACSVMMGAISMRAGLDWHRSFRAR